jgi:hypothetical protein
MIAVPGDHCLEGPGRGTQSPTPLGKYSQSKWRRCEGKRPTGVFDHLDSRYFTFNRVANLGNAARLEIPLPAAAPAA